MYINIKISRKRQFALVLMEGITLEDLGYHSELQPAHIPLRAPERGTVGSYRSHGENADHLDIKQDILPSALVFPVTPLNLLVLS